MGDSLVSCSNLKETRRHVNVPYLPVRDSVPFPSSFQHNYLRPSKRLPLYVNPTQLTAAKNRSCSLKNRLIIIRGPSQLPIPAQQTYVTSPRRSGLSIPIAGIHFFLTAFTATGTKPFTSHNNTRPSPTNQHFPDHLTSALNPTPSETEQHLLLLGITNEYRR